jgi:hypothetical protein
MNHIRPITFDPVKLFHYAMRMEVTYIGTICDNLIFSNTQESNIRDCRHRGVP